MAVTTICALFITRFALRALGVDDFGLFSVVGSVISFVSIINTIMVSTSNRFISVAIGKGDVSEVNRVYNVCLTIHVAIAILTALIAYPLGHWYIHLYVNYNGPIENAIMVYDLAVLGSILAFVSVPFHGLLMAKERFVVFCSVDMLSHVMKLAAAISMVYFFKNKLLFYASTQAFLTAAPTLIFWLYCRDKFPIITKWNFVRNRQLYKEMLGFSGWVGYGAIATIGKTQGAQLLVNAFFNTAMNAALGVANTISNFIVMFARNVTQPMAPQITKCYAAGDLNRCNFLLILCTKTSFMTMFLISSPFFSDIDWILKLWLGEVPEFASLFAKLLVLDALIGTFNAGIANVIFANGNIAFFQFTVHTSKLTAIIVSYLFLKADAVPYVIFYVYIVFSIINVALIQIALRNVGGFSFLTLAKGSYIPSLLVCAFYIPILFVHMPISPFFHMVIVLAYLILLVTFVGFNKIERNYIIKTISNLIVKKSHQDCYN